MNIPTRIQTDLTVRSFAYAASQLAHSQAVLAPSALYEQILGEAEKYRGALRLAKRDMLEMADQELRKQTLTKVEYRALLETSTQTVEHAQQAITRIVAQYAPHKLAA